MMHLKSNKTGVADLSDFSGYISSKQNSVLSLTKLVIVVSALLAIVMLVSK
jgi:hypothetical protein